MSQIERTAAMPREGLIPAFDAGWSAHEIGLARETVSAFAADYRWALLGWDCRQACVAIREEP